MYILVFIFALTIHKIQCAITIQRNSNDQYVFVLNKNETYLRGSNYLRLANGSMPILFEPDLYLQWREDIEIAMKQMHDYGYNYVRVFIDCPAMYRGFNLSTPGVPMSFTQNIVDFLLTASKYEIAVMLTHIWTPINYQSIIMSYPVPPNVTGMNDVIFHEGQAVGKAQFFIDLLEEIQRVNLIAFENIFAIDIFNEISVSVHEQPYSLTSGIEIRILFDISF